ncbi:MULTISPECIES: hypothetical protein [Methanobacterium]|jgi:hypothetical protein|uniref:Uncharacterized protein n=1 Tax=Methanobacterium veterum TaxID=408577 RepID=A0A9E5A1D9_9EURY|nr:MULTISPECIES: hypothetical protein [Methanobacterium]MCZ3364984.1 hypothetical protein [Methanobacterium veterum]MCZ3372739.1 hypothetical protein [Methanobacterium veterum]
MVQKNARWKSYFKTRMYIASFILAMVGWFILFVYLFGQFFEKELIVLEGSIQSPFFIWGLRILIIALVVLLIKEKGKIKKLFESVRWAVYATYLIGALGWLAWFLSLFSN